MAVVVFNKTRPYPRWLAVPARSHTHSQRLRYYRNQYQAQPFWADTKAIRAIYREAARRRKAGEDVVVDHIVPLASYNVSGLHVHYNLAIVPRKYNGAKSNNRHPYHPQGDLFEATHASEFWELTHV